LTLEQKILDILARLSTLSEAGTSNLEPRTSHGAADSKTMFRALEISRAQKLQGLAIVGFARMASGGTPA
jgi:hypothetical protein